MNQIRWYFLVLLCGSVHGSEAQLRVYDPLRLNVFGGVTRVESIFTPESGGWYDAVVQGNELRMGSKTIQWEPSISCHGQQYKTTTHSCHVQAGSYLMWYIYGRITEPEDPVSGTYHGTALFTVRGPDDLFTASIPVRFTVPSPEPRCEIRQSGAVDFGEVEANTSGWILLHSQTGQRTAQGYSLQKKLASPYRLAYLTLSTNVPSVMISVDAPSVLQSNGSMVGFTSQLSYKSALSPTYQPLLEGSGSRRIQSGGQEILFRLGGSVQTYSTSLEANYQGKITLTVICEQIP